MQPPVHRNPLRQLFSADSMTLKLMIIGLLVLVLLIPASWIQELMEERQDRAHEAVREITEKWSGSQTLSGPVLAIPYRVAHVTKNDQGDEVEEVSHTAYFLPASLSVKGTVHPQVLQRGIFEAVVYQSDLSLSATFARPDLSALNIPENAVIEWNKAFMVIALTGLEGINQMPRVTAGDAVLTPAPAASLSFSVPKGFVVNAGNETAAAAQPEPPSRSGLVAPLNWQSAADFTPHASVTISLRGSHGLYFVPTGKETHVHLEGEWSTPSFDGHFLPQQRDVNDQGFTADWNVLHYNRPIPQQWIDRHALDDVAFGLRLLVPIEQYQQSMRTAKYAHLIIILTFMALFLMEITLRLRIHPFQYLLVAAALIIYYTLLLSFSEQLGFTPAYWIATISTVALIGWYAGTFLKKTWRALQFTLLLAFLYAFIFVIVLHQDLSLLIGSAGLFVAVAILMYGSRNINWYPDAREAG